MFSYRDFSNRKIHSRLAGCVANKTLIFERKNNAKIGSKKIITFSELLSDTHFSSSPVYYYMEYELIPSVFPVSQLSRNNEIRKKKPAYLN